jgi:hypothetical protein
VDAEREREIERGGSEREREPERTKGACCDCCRKSEFQNVWRCSDVCVVGHVAVSSDQITA